MKAVIVNEILIDSLKKPLKGHKELLLLIKEKVITPLYSDQTMTQLVDILLTENISKTTIKDFISFLCHCGEYIKVKSSIINLTSSEDKLFINLAVDGKAQFIITNDINRFCKADGYKLINVIELSSFVANIK